MQREEGLLNKKWGFIGEGEKTFIQRRADNTFFLYIKCKSFFTGYITRLFLLSFTYLLACLVTQARHALMSIPAAALGVETFYFLPPKQLRTPWLGSSRPTPAVCEVI